MNTNLLTTWGSTESDIDPNEAGIFEFYSRSGDVKRITKSEFLGMQF